MKLQTFMKTSRLDKNHDFHAKSVIINPRKITDRFSNQAANSVSSSFKTRITISSKWNQLSKNQHGSSMSRATNEIPRFSKKLARILPLHERETNRKSIGISVSTIHAQRGNYGNLFSCLLDKYFVKAFKSIVFATQCGNCGVFTITFFAKKWKKFPWNWSRSKIVSIYLVKPLSGIANSKFSRNFAPEILINFNRGGFKLLYFT